MVRTRRMGIAFICCLALALSAIACGGEIADEAAIAVYLETKSTELEQPAGASDTPVPFTIDSGESVATIASRLEQLGLISDAELFRRYVQFHEMDSGIEAGEFVLRQTMTIPQVASALQDARRPEQTVTVREGIRLEEVAATVAEQTTVSEQEFLALATHGWRDTALMQDFPFLAALPGDATLEGFLYPETYRLPELAGAADLVTRMLQTFDERVTPEMRQAAELQGLDLYQMITLASIVEREAVVASERPLIAGVYLNRLDEGWLLAADPTIQYSLGTPAEWWPQLTLDDLERDLPYNTYKLVGLPPSPIASPGLGSVSAVAYPTETDYYFFLADCEQGDGSHAFSKTYDEHVQKYAACGG